MCVHVTRLSERCRMWYFQLSTSTIPTQPLFFYTADNPLTVITSCYFKPEHIDFMKQFAPRLVGLKIGNKGIPEKVCANISGLKSLQIESYHGCIKKDLTLFRQSSTSLEELVLKYDYGFKYFINIAYNFTQLTKLEIVAKEDKRGISNSDADWLNIETMIDHCPNLKKLSIHGIEVNKQRVANYPKIKSNSITRLELKLCGGAASSMCADIMMSCKNTLTDLSLHLTDLGIWNLSWYLPAVKRVVIRPHCVMHGYEIWSHFDQDAAIRSEDDNGAYRKALFERKPLSFPYFKF